MTRFETDYIPRVNAWNVDNDASYVSYLMVSTQTNLAPTESVWMVPGTYQGDDE